MLIFRLMIFFLGFVISLTIGVWVYDPIDTFFEQVETIYLRLKSLENVIGGSTREALGHVTDKYNEIARLFGLEAAQEIAKQEVTTTEAEKDFFEKLFEYNLAFWTSSLVSLLTFSIYLNIVSFFGFLLKPFLFLIPKDK